MNKSYDGIPRVNKNRVVNIENRSTAMFSQHPPQSKPLARHCFSQKTAAFSSDQTKTSSHHRFHSVVQTKKATPFHELSKVEIGKLEHIQRQGQFEIYKPPGDVQVAKFCDLVGKGYLRQAEAALTVCDQSSPGYRFNLALLLMLTD